MPALPRFRTRDISNASLPLSPTLCALLITLIVLLIISVLLAAALYVLRAKKRASLASQAAQESFQTITFSQNQTSKHGHHRLTITTPLNPSSRSRSHSHRSSKTYVHDEKELPPGSASPLPEIRITLPEEEDNCGKRKSGRVVVVRISDGGEVGLEPFHDEELPAYCSEGGGGEKFESLDLERIGGLKELEIHTRRV